MGSHAAVAAEFLGREKVDAALYGAAEGEEASGDLDLREQVMIDLAAVAGHPGSRSRVAAAPEIEAAIVRCKAAGWGEGAVYHAITVIALFNFYNAWVDCSGVEPLTAEGYAASGVRLKTRGYMMQNEIAAADQGR